MKIFFRFIFIICIAVCFCQNTQAQTDSTRQEGPTVLIMTNKGNIKIRLYNDTPIHRDFFLSQIRKGYFDGSLFGRVILGFVIQGGSEDSKGAPPGMIVGHGRSAMLLPPEIRSHHIPKKGAVAMPRQPDDVNPQRKSDASQFFIVQGRVFPMRELEAMELQRNMPTRKKALAKFYTPIKPKLDSLKRSNPRLYNEKVVEVNARIDSMIRRNPNHLLYSKAEKEAYSTVGGAPHIRGEYTIFGEVIDGFDVIDKIAEMEVDRNSRPKQDVTMRLKIQ